MKNKQVISLNTSLSFINNKPTLYFSIPYIPKLSEKLSYSLMSQCPNVKISFSTSANKLKSHLSKTKDAREPLGNHGIYRLNCHCGELYIGRTIRNFKTRTKEHIAQALNHLKRGSHISSAFSRHLVDSGHVSSINLDFKPQILHIGGNTNYLNSLECLEILLHNKENKILNNIVEFTDNCFLPQIVEIMQN